MVTDAQEFGFVIPLAFANNPDLNRVTEAQKVGFVFPIALPNSESELRRIH